MTSSSHPGRHRPAGTGSFRDTVQLLAGAQKKAAPGSPPYSVYVNRKVGRYVAAGCFLRGLTPNVVSGISALFTMTAIVLVAAVAPQWWLGLLVWAALAIGYAFDSADGQVARLRGGGSAAGEWLDHVLDSLKISSLHLAVLVTVYRHFDLRGDVWLLVPVGYTIVAAVSFFSMILNDQLKTIHELRSGAGAKMNQSPSRSVAKTVLLLPTDYGILCLVFLLLGVPWLFFVLYSVLFAANLGHLLLASVKWFRDMQRLDPHYQLSPQE